MTMTDVHDIVAELDALANEKCRQGMARYGLDVSNARGVSVTYLRQLARPLGCDHSLAIALWAEGSWECRELATMVADPAMMTVELMESWITDVTDWGLCDACCNNLFRRSPLAWGMIVPWASRDGEYVRRAAFALIASLAVHDRISEDERFIELLPLVTSAAIDPRHYVKKAVSWALRQMGKRNLSLHAMVVATAEHMILSDDRTTIWVAKDVLRELRGEPVLSRLGVKGT